MKQVGFVKRLTIIFASFVMLAKAFGVQEEKTAASVFIDFAKKHYGDDFDQNMAGQKADRAKMVWSEKIIYHSRDWTAQEANLFLGFLIENIGEQGTLKRMKTFPDLFRLGMSYQKFNQTYTILSAWAGKTAVIKKINKSLAGFQNELSEGAAIHLLNFFRNDKSDPHEMMELLETYLEGLKDQTKENRESLISSLKNIFYRKGRLEDFDRDAFISRLKNHFDELKIPPNDASVFIGFMDDYLQSWNFIKDMMLKNLKSFSLIDTEQFDRVVAWLKERGISEGLIKEIFKKSVMAAEEANKDKLEKISQHMEAFFAGNDAKVLVDSMILQNLGDFSQIDTKKFDEMVNWLKERNIPENLIKKAFKNNAKAARKANKEKLQKIASHMENFFGGDNARALIDSMMLKNLAAFSQINTKKFDNVIAWLKKRGIDQGQMKEIFKENAGAASLADKKKLEEIASHMEDFFGGDNAKALINSMILQNLGSFSQIDTGRFSEAVAWLKERGISEEAIKETFKGSSGAAKFARKEKLKEVASHMENFFGGNKAKTLTDSMMLQNLAAFSQIDTKQFDRVISWFKERGIPEKNIKESFKENANGAMLANKDEMKKITSHMEAFFGGDDAKNIVNSMMLKNISNFAQIDTQKFDEMVTWLRERDIPENLIKETFKESANAKNMVNKDKMEKIALHMENFIGGDKAKTLVDSMILRNLKAFSQVDTEQFDHAVNWLRERGISENKIKEAFTRSAKAARDVSKEKLEKVSQYMEVFFGGNDAKTLTNSVMMKNISSFSQIDTDKFSETIVWLKGRGIPEDKIKEVFKRSAKPARGVSKDKLEKVSRHMEAFFGGDNAKALTNSMILKNLDSFSQIDADKFQEAVSWLKERGIPETQIKEAFQTSVQTARLADKEKLEKVSQYMEAFFGGDNPKTLVNSMILQSLGRFSQVDTDKFHEAVTWLKERGIPETQIKEIFQKSVEAAIVIDKDKLEKITLYMEIFFGGDNAKSVTNSMMLKNLGAFSLIETDKFQEVIDWSKERGIDEEAIKEAFKENARAASVVEKDKMEKIASYMETFFGGDDVKSMVNSMILQNLGDFSQIDTDKFREAFDWLKKRGVSENKIKTAFKGNIAAARMVSKDKLEMVSQSMDAFPANEDADLNLLFERINERDCRLLTNILLHP